MTLSLLSKNEHTIEQSIALFETICKKNNWPYEPEEFKISYHTLFPKGSCDFSIWTSYLIEDLILVGSIKNSKNDHSEYVAEQDYLYINFFLELRYEDQHDWSSNKGKVFLYQFMKEFLIYRPDWIFVDEDEKRKVYNVDNMDDFAKSRRISPDAFSFDFTNPPQ